MVGIGLVDGPYHGAHKEYQIDNLAGIERTAKHVDKQQLKPSAHGDDARHDAVKHCCHQDKRDGEGNKRTLELDIGELAVGKHQHDGGNTQQIEQVYADAQASHIGNQHTPTVGVGLIGVVFPLEDKPEHNGGEGGRISVDLALDCREPEGITEGIDKRTYQTRSLDGYHAAGGHIAPVLDYQPARKVGDTPEKEENGGGAEQRTHGVDHAGHHRRVAYKLGEEVGGEHEEWCPRWMAYLHLVAGGDKLRTVPERGSRLNGRTIDYSCHKECKPAENVVHNFVLFHCYYVIINNFGPIYTCKVTAFRARKCSNDKENEKDVFFLISFYISA